MPPRSAPPSLTEPELRRMTKAVPFAAAQANLALGHPRLRKQFTNGVLVTWWEDETVSPTQVMFRDGADPFLMECTCDDFAERGKCEHANAAALAWVRQPNSFALNTEAFDLERFFSQIDGASTEIILDDDLGYDDDEDLEELVDVGAHPGPAVPAPLPASPVTTTTSPSGELRAVVTIRLPPLNPAAQRAVLDHLNLTQLRAIAQRRGVKLSGVKRDAVLDTLSAALSDTDAVRAFLPSLSPTARLVLTVLPFVTNYLGVMAHQLQAAVGVFDTTRLPQLDAALQELLAAGLLAVTPYGYYTWPAGVDMLLPPDPAVLRPYTDSPNKLRVVAAPPPLNFAALTTRLLLALHSGASTLRARPAPEPHPLEAQLPNLARGWSYFPGELESIARQKSPQQAVNKYAFSVPPAPPLLTDAARAALSAQLQAPAEVLDFALHVLVGRGLVRLPPGGAPQVDPAIFVSYLSLHPLAQLMPLFNAYREHTDWTEFDLAAPAVLGCC